MSTQQLHPDVAPPEFLQLAGHPLRWRLLSELARSDRMVHELTGLVGEPQNLVSYHLGKLRDGRLVSARRSSADRRDTYYGLDLARIGGLLSATGGALHPGLRLAPPSRDGARIGAGEGAVPVHRQQRALADGRGAGPGAVGRGHRGVQRRQPSQAPAPQRGAGDARRVRPRPGRSRVQAPGRVRRPALRLGDQPVRPGARGVPRVPRPPRDHPLEHRQPRDRRARRRHLSAVPANGRRAGDPHRVPARRARRPNTRARSQGEAHDRPQ